MSDSIFRHSPGIIVKQFFFSVELFCYSAYSNLSSLCSSLCRRSCSSSRSRMSSHCARYCAIGFSGKEVCKALMAPRSAPPWITRRDLKKKKKSYLFYSVSDLSSREHLIQSTPSDILKLQLTNIYWVTPFAQVILLGLLTQARLLTHIELFYDQPCHLLLLGVDFIWFIQK